MRLKNSIQGMPCCRKLHQAFLVVALLLLTCIPAQAEPLRDLACEGISSQNCDTFTSSLTKKETKALTANLDHCFEKPEIGIQFSSMCEFEIADHFMNFSAATRIFKKGCEVGQKTMCARLAIANFDGEGVPKNHDKGIEIMEELCQQQNFKPACIYLMNYFTSYRAADDLPLDTQRALNYVLPGCQSGDKTYCYYARSGYEDLEDYQNVFGIYEIDCNQGDASACNQAARLKYFGDELPIDMPVAISFFERGCEGGNRFSCGYLGDIYSEGDGVTVDPDEASTYYAKACKLGDKDYC